MFAGAEKEFAPGDKRRLELTSGGKMRWKNADKEDSGKLQVASGKPTFQEEMQSKYENAKKNLNIDDDLELLNELEKRLKEIPEPNMNRVMKDDKEAEKLRERNKHENVIRFIKKKNNFQDAPNRDQLYYHSKDTDWLKKRNSAIASRVLDGKATDRELKINEAILEELEKRGEKKPNKEIDYSQELINTVQISKTYDIFFTNVMLHKFPNEFLKTELKLGDDRAQNEKKLKDYYNKQRAAYKEGRKKDKEETDRAIAEFHVDEIERIALQQNAEYEKKLADRSSIETVKNPVQSEPDLVKKEPWERTLSDMVQKEITNREIFGPESYPKWITDNTKVEIADRRTGIVYNHFTLANPIPERLKHYGKLAHYEIVKRALSEGKPVPPEVLKDYPELENIEKANQITRDVVRGKLSMPEATQKLNELETSLISEEKKGEKASDDIKKLIPFHSSKSFEYLNLNTKTGKVFYKPIIKLDGLGSIQGYELKTYETTFAEIAKNYGKLPTELKTAIDQFAKKDINLYNKLINMEISTTKSIFKNLFKAFGKQISMFGAQPYEKEGQTKEGRGGTLKLTRDSSGKGAHWKLVGKGQQAVGSGQSVVGSQQLAEKQTGGKIITPANAFELLQDKIGNSVLLKDNEGNLLGEGALQLVNENSEGNYSLFLKEANGFDSLVSIPKNQAVVQKEDGISFKFADKNIVISTKEKSKIPNKPVEMEKAEENAKHARNLEKMRNFNEWQKKADSYARLANGQKDWFFGDIENATEAEGIDFRTKDKIIKKPDVMFKEIKRNATKDDKAEIYSALIGAVEVKSIAKAKAVIQQLKKKGYEIDSDKFDNVEDKENFFTRVKISKGENDPLPKELQFATGEYAKAFDECAKKPNPLRETEMSLGLKIDAERVPEFNTIKKQLFNQAGEGLGQMWITGGLPGSGKSTTLGGEFYKNKVLIDPDSIKYMLAEERGISKIDVDLRPWELHEESSVIAKHLVREAIREKKDIIYDISMKGTANLNDLLYMVNSDTFQANAEFIHLPIEKGIERDKARGEKGGRSIGADLYKKLFGDYPTHKAFFELKDSFDNFRVYDNSAPLGEGAKLFYVKNDGQEKILHPELHEEFKKFGLKQMGKSLYLKYQRRKLLKALGTEPQPAESGNTQELPTSEKLKLMLGFKEQGIDREIDPEQDFFALGMLKMHGLIDENMNLTPEGEQKYQFQFGNKFSNMNGEENEIEKVVKPTLNIANETNGEKKPSIKAFGKEFKKGKQ
jgi:hypothetical protein